MLEAKMRSFVAPLSPPVDFARSCNARRLFAQVTCHPWASTITHLSLRTLMNSENSSQCMTPKSRRLILTNNSAAVVIDRVEEITVTRFGSKMAANGAGPNLFTIGILNPEGRPL